jgi:hypothetical protein
LSCEKLFSVSWWEKNTDIWGWKRERERDMCVCVGVWHVHPKKHAIPPSSCENEVKINFILISCDLIKKMWIKRVKAFYGLKSKQMEYLIFYSRSFLRSVVMHFCALYAFEYRGLLREFWVLSSGWKNCETNLWKLENKAKLLKTARKFFQQLLESFTATAIKLISIFIFSKI